MDMTEARAAMEQVGQITAAMSSMKSDDAVAAITSLMVAHQCLMCTGGSVGLLHGQLYAYPYFPFFPMPPDGYASCSATACTFTDYGFGGGYDYFSTDGGVTASGNLVTLHVAYNQEQTHVGSIKWTLDGSLSTMGGGLDGSMHDHGVGYGNFDGVTWDVTVDYQAITRDAQGCPTGGSLHAVMQYEAVASAQRTDAPLTLARQGSAAFGPGCR